MTMPSQRSPDYTIISGESSKGMEMYSNDKLSSPFLTTINRSAKSSNSISSLSPSVVGMSNSNGSVSKSIKSNSRTIGASSPNACNVPLKSPWSPSFTATHNRKVKSQDFATPLTEASTPMSTTLNNSSSSSSNYSNDCSFENDANNDLDNDVTNNSDYASFTSNIALFHANRSQSVVKFSDKTEDISASTTTPTIVYDGVPVEESLERYVRSPRFARKVRTRKSKRRGNEQQSTSTIASTSDTNHLLPPSRRRRNREHSPLLSSDGTSQPTKQYLNPIWTSSSSSSDTDSNSSSHSPRSSDSAEGNYVVSNHDSFLKQLVRLAHTKGILWLLVTFGITSITFLTVWSQNDLWHEQNRNTAISNEPMTVLFPTSTTPALRGGTFWTSYGPTTTVHTSGKQYAKHTKKAKSREQNLKQEVFSGISSVNKPTDTLSVPSMDQITKFVPHFVDWKAIQHPLSPKKTIPSSKRQFSKHDRHLYSLSDSQSSATTLSPHSRVFIADESIVVAAAKHRHIVQYPPDFTDATQLYGLLDSSDERIELMEPREPYVQGECVPMQDWQTTFYPTCNEVHELGMHHLLPSVYGNHDFDLFGLKGFWRNAWKVSKQNGLATEAEWDTIVLKTLRIQHNFEEAHFEHDRIDAVAMERLTSSPHVIDIFGFCGHSVLTEYADGSRLGALADKAKSHPLERLKIARDIAEGLADVHGIDGDGNTTFVHLDINPANVVSINGRLKLNDFNIGIIRKWNTTSNSPCGFPAQYPNAQWRSPEEAREQNDLTEKVDVFALGHIFFRLICGHEPWSYFEVGGKPSKDELLAKVQKGKLPTIPNDVIESTDPEVVAIRKAMLACYTHDPKKRPSARQIAHELEKTVDKLEKAAVAST